MEIDSAALVSEIGDLTLNELVEGIDGIYPEIKSMLADVVIGDIKISDFMSLRSFGDNLRRIIDSVDIRGSVSVSVNADGEVVDFSYDRELWVRPDLDVDEEYEHNLSIKLSITKDDSIVVEVPEDVKAKAEKAE